MENGFFLITGTSRGIGAALAKKLVEKGNTVLGVSRNRPSGLESTKYHHFSFDLANTSRLNQIIEKTNEIVNGQAFAFWCLVSNASAAEPIRSIEKCPAAEIEAHVRVGLIAPMILTSMFIRNFSHSKGRKKLVFISSGSAVNPMLDGSIYSSSKAGLNMFGRCVGLEQENREQGFEVVSIAPGMVDTAMQKIARSKTSDEFALADFFKQAFETGQLQDPADVAEKIYRIVEGTFENGAFVRCNDI